MMRTAAWMVLPLIAVIGSVFGAQMLSDYVSCSSRWEGSSYATRWGPLRGCQVQVAGKWLPEAMMRDTTVRQQ